MAERRRRGREEERERLREGERERWSEGERRQRGGSEEEGTKEGDQLPRRPPNQPPLASKSAETQNVQTLCFKKNASATISLVGLSYFHNIVSSDKGRGLVRLTGLDVIGHVQTRPGSPS